MKRYDPHHYCMMESPDGRYVKFDEVETLLLKMKKQLEELKEKLMGEGVPVD